MSIELDTSLLDPIHETKTQWTRDKSQIRRASTHHQQRPLPVPVPTRKASRRPSSTATAAAPVSEISNNQYFNSGKTRRTRKRRNS
jgi:hypothetical protein